MTDSQIGLFTNNHLTKLYLLEHLFGTPWSFYVLGQPWVLNIAWLPAVSICCSLIKGKRVTPRSTQTTGNGPGNELLHSSSAWCMTCSNSRLEENMWQRIIYCRVIPLHTGLISLKKNEELVRDLNLEVQSLQTMIYF